MELLFVVFKCLLNRMGTLEHFNLHPDCLNNEATEGETHGTQISGHSFKFGWGCLFLDAPIPGLRSRVA